MSFARRRDGTPGRASRQRGGGPCSGVGSPARASGGSRGAAPAPASPPGVRLLPRPVVHRLTQYLACVHGLLERNVRWVTSRELADFMRVTSSTVRQDLSHLDFAGKSKCGYQVLGLESVLAAALGSDVSVNMVLVGAGNLGRALVRHAEFAKRGFRFCAIVDADPKLAGRRVGEADVQPMSALPDLVRRRGAAIGVIAVPPASAQSVADYLVASGIRAILNLAYAHVLVPRRVALVETRLIANLRELLYSIRVGGERAPASPARGPAAGTARRVSA